MNYLKRYKTEIIFLFIGGLTTRFFDWLTASIIELVIDLSQKAADYYYGTVATYTVLSLVNSFYGFFAILFLISFYIILQKATVSRRSHIQQEKGAIDKYLALPILIGMLAYLGTCTYYSFCRRQAAENEIFASKVKAIAPYVTDKEIQQLNSWWVTMRSKNDYQRINNRLNSHLKATKLDKFFD